MEKKFVNLGIIISDEDMSVLRGGVAEVSNAIEEPSQSGDGARYVCCVKITLPSN